MAARCSMRSGDAPGGEGLEDIGPYTLVKPVGRGGLGVVYRAIDKRSGHVVALKVLHRATFDATAARRLSREFRALHAIQHPNIVRVLDAGVHDDAPYLAMELVQGLPLRSYLECRADVDCCTTRPLPVASRAALASSGAGESERRKFLTGAGGVVGAQHGLPDWDEACTTDHGCPPLAWLQGTDEPDSLPPLPAPARRGRSSDPNAATEPSVCRVSTEQQRFLNRPERVRKLREAMAQLCDGLGFIHERRLVHRDIKPANILVEDGGRAKLVDFGLVKLADSGNTTAAGHVVGTYRYMSPEQARGAPVDGRADLYALGGVLYDMLCGHPPFTQKQTVGLLEAIIRERPPDPREVNPEADEMLCGVAMRLLEKQPENRFSSADEVARVLRQGQGR